MAFKSFSHHSKYRKNGTGSSRCKSENKKYLKFEAPSSGMFTVLCSAKWAWIDIRNSDGIDVGTNSAYDSEYRFGTEFMFEVRHIT